MSNTNNTNVRRAVALRYQPREDDAPLVIAKGERLMAERIIEAAKELGMHIVEDSQLSASLVRLEVRQEIPPELYQAVAEVIAFVFRLHHRSRDGSL
ncbi:MAG: EscU/YscU/HrcU family type III secretion system export apparatus switch protein [Symbiobacteriaceae bacterium]|nr:EscU/YscU/HrcU family type III secretion system export apparatus switch protein [Symbiobacteriaceae bacterium]